MPRYSADFMTRPQGLVVSRSLYPCGDEANAKRQAVSHARPPGHETAAERHLVRHPRQAIARLRLGQPGDLEQDHARLDDRGPVLRLALALAHARLGGN